MKVYSAPNLAMVGNMKNILEIHGIACEIRGENRYIGAGELPPIECWPELWVTDESKLAQAKQIIAEALKPSENELVTWKCPNCGEVVEGQFTECWNCRTNRPRSEET